MDTRKTIEISSNTLSQLKPCWKCHKQPVLKQDEGRFGWTLFTDYFISCPDDNCHNLYMLKGDTGKITEEDIINWNEQNVEKYVPKSQLKISEQNCRHCKYVKNCINVREERISQFFDEHICDDFEHN